MTVYHIKEMTMNRKDIIRICVIAVVLGACILAFDRIGNMQGNEETRLVHDAILEATMTCYAVEGMFPEDLAYLRENYRLAYNEDRYLVTYDAFASNRVPNIYVTERGAASH